jgi:hypothetical protein
VASSWRNLIAVAARLRSLLLACVLLSNPLLAATQGSTGATSSGSVDITLTANLTARISGLTDLLLGTWSGAGDLAGDQNICIGRNGAGFFGTATYRIRAEGNGDGTDINAFTLSNGVDLVYYNVFFNDQANLTGRQQLTGGLTLLGQTASGFSAILNLLFGCVTRNANVSVVVPETNLAGAPSGNYAGTLTIVLIPD